MNTGAAIESAQRNPVEEIALALGFKSDLQLLNRAADEANVDPQTREAHIRTYIESKEGPETYEPFFVIQFKQRAKKLEEARAKFVSEPEHCSMTTPKVQKNHKGRKKRSKIRVTSWRH